MDALAGQPLDQAHRQAAVKTEAENVRRAKPAPSAPQPAQQHAAMHAMMAAARFRADLILAS